MLMEILTRTGMEQEIHQEMLPLSSKGRGLKSFGLLAIKIFLVLLFITAGYVWLMDLLGLLVLKSDHLLGKSDVPWMLGFLTDTIGLALIVLLPFRLKAPIPLIGLGVALSGSLLKSYDYSHSPGMFWFEPILRSGVYVVAFVLAEAITTRKS